MYFPNLKSVSADQLRTAYKVDLAKDGKTGVNRVKIEDHVHYQVATYCETETDNEGLVYNEINLDVLANRQCGTVANYLMDRFVERGIRPDTPFHENQEERYPIDAVRYMRYVEYNVITGGMRLIFDAVNKRVFLSCHYSWPAEVTAPSGFGGRFASMIADMERTHKLLVKHSLGETASFLDAAADDKDYEKRRTYLRSNAAMSPTFVAYLKNPNARQNAAVISRLYAV